MPSSPPAVSVVMPVHNGEKYLRAAIDSVLRQTLANFELIIVNDGSTDGTAEIIQGYRDPRIRIIRLEKAGLVKALNEGIDASSGLLVARMDADDVCSSERLARQCEYMHNHPDIDILCSDVNIINANGLLIGKQVQREFNNDVLRDALLYQRTIKPIIHPSVMARKEVFSALSGYREYEAGEDHDLWLRALDRFKFARTHEVLLDYRIHSGGVSRSKSSRQAASSAMSAVNYLVKRSAGIDLFVDHPEVFRKSTAEVMMLLEEQVIPAAAAFRSARLEIQTKRRSLVPYIKLTAALVRHGRKATPSGATRTTGRIVRETADRVSRELVG